MVYDESDCKHLYERTRKELSDAIRANAEQFDKSVLTLSAGFLAISIGFISDITSPESLVYAWLLQASWILFGLTIILALHGILYGSHILQRLMHNAHEYYINKDDCARENSDKISKRIEFINYFVGFLFALAVTTTIVFATLNFGDNIMTTQKTDEVKRSQTANALQKRPDKNQNDNSNQNQDTQQSEKNKNNS